MPIKQAPHKSAQDKLIGLFALLLFRRGRHTLSQLARALDCSKQTVLRMIETIERSHYLEIESGIEKRQRYFRAAEPRQRPAAALTPEAIQQLLLCRDLVCHMLPQPLHDEITATIHKTTTLLPDFESRAGAFDSLAQAVPHGAIDYEPVAGILDTLFDAMRTRRVCRVVYHAPGKPNHKEYHIGPCRFIAVREVLYVVARLIPKPGDRAYDDALTLAAHRFRSAELTAESFDPLPETAMPSYEAFGFAFEPPFTVQARFSPNAAPYIAERIWSRGQRIAKRRDGSLDLTFTAVNRAEVIAWLLSFGPEAELLEPNELRDEMANRLEMTRQVYGDTSKEGGPP